MNDEMGPTYVVPFKVLGQEFSTRHIRKMNGDIQVFQILMPIEIFDGVFQIIHSDCLQVIFVGIYIFCLKVSIIQTSDCTQ